MKFGRSGKIWTVICLCMALALAAPEVNATGAALMKAGAKLKKAWNVAKPAMKKGALKGANIIRKAGSYALKKTAQKVGQMKDLLKAGSKKYAEIMAKQAQREAAMINNLKNQLIRKGQEAKAALTMAKQQLAPKLNALRAAAAQTAKKATEAAVRQATKTAPLQMAQLEYAMLKAQQNIPKMKAAYQAALQKGPAAIKQVKAIYATEIMLAKTGAKNIRDALPHLIKGTDNYRTYVKTPLDKASKMEAKQGWTETAFRTLDIGGNLGSSIGAGSISISGGPIFTALGGLVLSELGGQVWENTGGQVCQRFGGYGDYSGKATAVPGEKLAGKSDILFATRKEFQAARNLIRKEKEAKGLSSKVTYEEIATKILQKKIAALKTELAKLQKGPKAKPPLPPSKRASKPVVKKAPLRIMVKPDSEKVKWGEKVTGSIRIKGGTPPFQISGPVKGELTGREGTFTLKAPRKKGVQTLDFAATDAKKRTARAGVAVEVIVDPLSASLKLKKSLILPGSQVYGTILIGGGHPKFIVKGPVDGELTKRSGEFNFRGPTEHGTYTVKFTVSDDAKQRVVAQAKLRVGGSVGGAKFRAAKGPATDFRGRLIGGMKGKIAFKLQGHLVSGYVSGPFGRANLLGRYDKSRNLISAYALLSGRKIRVTGKRNGNRCSGKWDMFGGNTIPSGTWSASK